MLLHPPAAAASSAQNATIAVRFQRFLIIPFPPQLGEPARIPRCRRGKPLRNSHQVSAISRQRARASSPFADPGGDLDERRLPADSPSCLFGRGRGGHEVPLSTAIRPHNRQNRISRCNACHPDNRHDTNNPDNRIVRQSHNLQRKTRWRGIPWRLPPRRGIRMARNRAGVTAYAG